MYFKKWITLDESKQSIIGLGYPEIIAKIFYEKFGNKAPLLARWFKEDNSIGKDDPAWWKGRVGTYNGHNNYCRLWQATFDPEEYVRVCKQLELSDVSVDEMHLREMRQSLKEQISKELLKEYFFSLSFIKSIMNGTLTDLSPYKNLSFEDAWKRYEKKRIFADQKPIKVYKDGYKWIDVGKRCPLVGQEMSNCGSAGLMSMDKDATILVLFDDNNKPHVITTYSPNEKRISGDEGGASSAVKTKYHRYVIDLAETLGATFDSGKSKSDLLGIKYKLRNTASKIQQLNKKTYFDSTFRFVINGKIYYSDRYVAVEADDYVKMRQAVKEGL